MENRRQRQPGWASTHAFKTRLRSAPTSAPRALNLLTQSRLPRFLSHTTPLENDHTALSATQERTSPVVAPNRQPGTLRSPQQTSQVNRNTLSLSGGTQLVLPSFFQRLPSSRAPWPASTLATPAPPNPTQQRRFSQRSLTGETLRPSFGMGSGHSMDLSASKSYRIVSQNINGIPKWASEMKSRFLIHRLSTSSHGDIHLWQEINLLPHLLPLPDSWETRTRKANLTTVFSVNVREPFPLLQQPGGTAAFATTRLQSRTLETFSDDLGRWAAIRIGNRTHSTVFVSAYRPCKSTGESTVYQQHRRAADDPAHDPRSAMLADLSNAVATWHTLGYVVVVGMDANEDILSRRMKEFQQTAGLWNPLLEVHGPSIITATHSRNFSDTAIDAIFCTRGISPVYCGISPVGGGCPSDHVQLWADFKASDLFGPGEDFGHTPSDPLNSANPC